MRDIPCTICGRLIEPWGSRWRHVRRQSAGADHTATPPNLSARPAPALDKNGITPVEDRLQADPYLDPVPLGEVRTGSGPAAVRETWP